MAGKKIINTYVRWLEDKANARSLDLPCNTRHIVIGGEDDTVVGYDICSNGEVTYIDTEAFKSKHPEADTGLFCALFIILQQYESSDNRRSLVIDCPETDCLTIALLQYHRIKCLLDEKQVDLYLKMHSRKVDAFGKIAKT